MNKRKICIIAIPASNYISVERFVHRSGGIPILIDPSGLINEDFNDCDAILIPGVSSFSHTSEILMRPEINRLIKNYISNSKPIIGICAGMQVMFQNSEESAGQGLGIMRLKVRKLVPSHGLPIPNMGWYKLVDEKKILIEDFGPFYFSHSYGIEYDDVVQKVDWALTFNFGNQKILAAFRFENFYGFQFHPEKSSTQGGKLLNAIINNEL